MPAWPQTYGYTTDALVHAQAPYLAKTGFGTGTLPTLAQVNAWITEVAYMIDARANRQGYATPMTTGAGYSAATVSLCQTWSTIGVAGRAVMATENKVLEAGQRTTGRAMWTDFLKWLDSDDAFGLALTQTDTQSLGLDDGLSSVDPITGGDREPLFHVRERY